MARAQLDARLLPGRELRGVRPGHRERRSMDPRSRSRILRLSLSRLVHGHRPLPRHREVAARMDPGAIVVPRMIGGFTDAHCFRELGIVAYGFVPRALAGDDAACIHGIDERVSIDKLVASWSSRDDRRAPSTSWSQSGDVRCPTPVDALSDRLAQLLDRLVERSRRAAPRRPPRGTRRRHADRSGWSRSDRCRSSSSRCTRSFSASTPSTFTSMK